MEEPVRRRRGAGRHRGVPERARGVLLRAERWHRALPIGSAQDHKRTFDDDRGPNTGGWVRSRRARCDRPRCSHRIMREIVDPVLHGMRAEGRAVYRVPLRRPDADRGGPPVIEFNVRFGDPEAQVVIPLVDGDWRRCWPPLPTGTPALAPGLRSQLVADWSASSCVARVSRQAPRGLPIAVLRSVADAEARPSFTPARCAAVATHRVHRRRPRADGGRPRADLSRRA